MIRVLVAEDSATVRELLVGILQEDPAIRVVGEAKNGQEAVELAVRLRPDLITMDIHMPVLDGLEATKEIMVHAPAPIVVVSSAVSRQDVALSLDATRAGALMVMTPPGDPRSAGFEERREQFLGMVKAMAGVKVVRRWAPRGALPARGRARPRDDETSAARLVVMAASTGGPAALQRILMDLPRDFPVPILIVQHIARGFVAGLSTWLEANCSLRIRVATHGERLEARTVYLAPDDRHLGVRAPGIALLSDAPPIGGFRPSATFLFRSAAECYGASVAAVILTGMGRDGVEGLRAVREAGGRVVAQDEVTSVVYGMPREAVLAGAADVVLPLQNIAERLVDLVQGCSNESLDPGR